jgi:DNA gyrase/topoisomerase IV subunit A
MELKIKGQTAEITFADVPIKHSGIYNLLFSENGEENLQAELIRIDSDIDLVEGMMKLDNNLDKVIATIRGSKNSDVASEKLLNQFGVTKEQETAYLDIELSEISKINFEVINQCLGEFRSCFTDIYNRHFPIQKRISNIKKKTGK